MIIEVLSLTKYAFPRIGMKLSLERVSPIFVDCQVSSNNMSPIEISKKTSKINMKYDSKLNEQRIWIPHIL